MRWAPSPTQSVRSPSTTTARSTSASTSRAASRRSRCMGLRRPRRRVRTTSCSTPCAGRTRLPRRPRSSPVSRSPSRHFHRHALRRAAGRAGGRQFSSCACLLAEASIVNDRSPLMILGAGRGGTSLLWSPSKTSSRTPSPVCASSASTSTSRSKSVCSRRRRARSCRFTTARPDFARKRRPSPTFPAGSSTTWRRTCATVDTRRPKAPLTRIEADVHPSTHPRCLSRRFRMYVRPGRVIAVASVCFLMGVGILAGCGGSHGSSAVPATDTGVLKPQLNGGNGHLGALSTLYVAGQGAVYAYDLTSLTSPPPSPGAMVSPAPISKSSGYYYQAGGPNGVNASIAGIATSSYGNLVVVQNFLNPQGDGNSCELVYIPARTSTDAPNATARTCNNTVGGNTTGTALAVTYTRPSA